MLDRHGDYTDEELKDPYGVIEQGWEETNEVLQTMLIEAVQVLDEPNKTEAASPRRANWLLADWTIFLKLHRADKDYPIEVCL